MKITVLIENTERDGFLCEHGLSLYIEHKGNIVLLDAGSTDKFMENARLLGVSLENIRVAVLSHGHYDHSGGFERYMEENKEVALYMMENADGEYYSGKGELHEIGIPKSVVKKHKDRFVYIKEVTQVGEGIFLVPHKTEGLDEVGARAKLYKKVDGEVIADDFAHEMSLVCDTEKGLVILNSCSHAGVRNIVSEIRNVFTEKAIYAFVGGLHMKGGEFSEEEIKTIIEYLRSEGIQYLYTGHCTGERAFSILKQAGGTMVQELVTGKIIEML